METLKSVTFNRGVVWQNKYLSELEIDNVKTMTDKDWQAALLKLKKIEQSLSHLVSLPTYSKEDLDKYIENEQNQIKHGRSGHPNKAGFIRFMSTDVSIFINMVGSAVSSFTTLIRLNHPKINKELKIVTDSINESLFKIGIKSNVSVNLYKKISPFDEDIVFTAIVAEKGLTTKRNFFQRSVDKFMPEKYMARSDVIPVKKIREWVDELQK